LPPGPGKDPESCGVTDEANIHPQIVWMKLEGGLGAISAGTISAGRVTVTLTCK